MRRVRARVGVAAVLAAAWSVLVTGVTPAFAQSTTAPTPPARWLLDVGARVVGRSAAGSLTETYTAPDGSAVPIFSVDRTEGSALGVNGHLQFKVTTRVALEATAAWTRPQLRTRVTGDSEADSVTATQSIHRVVVGGGVVGDAKTFGKWHTFVRGNVGWLRELSDDQSLYQDGWVAELGGGARYQWKEKQGHFRPYGIRADVWLEVRHGGLPFSEKARLWAPAFSAAMIFKL